MSDFARPLGDILRDAPEAAQLLALWHATDRAARCIAPVCHLLASGFDPLLPGRSQLRDGVLVLTASSSAQSAKLRQATPRLLSSLGSAGIQVYEIRVRIEPSVTSYPGQGTDTPSSADAAWLQTAPAASEAVRQLALTIADSPLKKAAEKLAATLRKRSRR